MARHLLLVRDGERPERETERELARRRRLATIRTTRERHRYADPQQQLLDDVHARRFHDAA
jgi:hypothetical protein